MKPIETKIATTPYRVGFKPLTMIRRFIRYLVMITGLLCFTLPLIWTLSGSFKPSSAIFTTPIKWIPEVWEWNNYVQVIYEFDFFRYFGNTLFITVMNVIGQVISSMIIAYGFARFRSRANQPLFLLVLATLMLPSEVLLIPTFLMYKELDWVGTYLPLIVPAFFGNAYNLFFLRQFIMGIPRELDESAKVDGATSFGILVRIIVPLCAPIIATIVVWTVNSTWRDFINPLIYISEPLRYTLQIGINNLVGGQGSVVDFGYVFAATITVLIPNLIIYAVGQKYISSGLSLAGSVKG